MKKIQFKIYVDPTVMERIQKLDGILNRYRGTDRHGKVRDNVNKSEYWEGIMKEHLNSREVIELMMLSDGKIKGEGLLE